MNLKKFIPAVALLAPFGVMAQEGTTTLDTTEITQMANNIKTGLSGMVDSIMPILVGIGVAVLILWLAPTIVSTIKSWYTKFKGR